MRINILLTNALNICDIAVTNEAEGSRVALSNLIALSVIPFYTTTSYPLKATMSTMAIQIAIRQVTSRIKAIQSDHPALRTLTIRDSKAHLKNQVEHR